MPMRRLAAALAIPCAWLMPTQVVAQPSRTYGPSDPGTQQTVRTDTSTGPQREAALEVREAPQEALRDGMLESWELEPNVQLGVGRFRVDDRAGRRSHIERVRNPASMEPEMRGIAGAGVRVRFR